MGPNGPDWEISRNQASEMNEKSYCKIITHIYKLENKNCLERTLVMEFNSKFKM